MLVRYGRTGLRLEGATRQHRSCFLFANHENLFTHRRVRYEQRSRRRVYVAHLQKSAVSRSKAIRGPTVSLYNSTIQSFKASAYYRTIRWRSKSIRLLALHYYLGDLPLFGHSITPDTMIPAYLSSRSFELPLDCM